ncbi:hypothetical protein OG771_37925 [Streptomyces anulatus]|nr:hypothetical protein [Streptomyces anulatus]
MEEATHRLRTDPQSLGDLHLPAAPGEEVERGEFLIGQQLSYHAGQDRPADVPVFGLHSDVGVAQSAGKFLGHGHRPLPATTPHNVDIDTEPAVGQRQQAQSTLQAPPDDLLEPRGRADVRAHIGLKAGGVQHPLPHGGIARRVAQRPGVDAERVTAGRIVVAVAVTRDDGPDQGRGGHGLSRSGT